MFLCYQYVASPHARYVSSNIALHTSSSIVLIDDGCPKNSGHGGVVLIFSSPEKLLTTIGNSPTALKHMHLLLSNRGISILTYIWKGISLLMGRLDEVEEPMMVESLQYPSSLIQRLDSHIVRDVLE